METRCLTRSLLGSQEAMEVRAETGRVARVVRERPELSISGVEAAAAPGSEKSLRPVLGYQPLAGLAAAPVTQAPLEVMGRVRLLPQTAGSSTFALRAA